MEKNYAENIKIMGCPPKGAVGASGSRGGGLDSIILDFRGVYLELQAPSITPGLALSLLVFNLSLAQFL